MNAQFAAAGIWKRRLSRDRPSWQWGRPFAGESMKGPLSVFPEAMAVAPTNALALARFALIARMG
jgi:hypothetical protein